MVLLVRVRRRKWMACFSLSLETKHNGRFLLQQEGPFSQSESVMNSRIQAQEIETAWLNKHRDNNC